MLVLEDVLDAKVSAVHARSAYGVVLQTTGVGDLIVDELATAKLRREMKP